MVVSLCIRSGKMFVNESYITNQKNNVKQKRYYKYHRKEDKP